MIHHQGNANQNDNVISHTCRDGYQKKKGWEGCGEIGILVHCWWECKIVQLLWKAEWSFLKKLKLLDWCSNFPIFSFLCSLCFLSLLFWSSTRIAGHDAVRLSGVKAPAFHGGEQPSPMCFPFGHWMLQPWCDASVFNMMLSEILLLFSFHLQRHPHWWFYDKPLSSELYSKLSLPVWCHWVIKSFCPNVPPIFHTCSF